ncbi:multidrug resistance protein D [Klebsiella oxytoca]|nr:multidrug resistance protein D [Klebsiella oxytoca]
MPWPLATAAWPLAAGSLFGALLNRRLLRQNVPLGQMLAIACILHLAGAAAVYVLRESLWFVAPVALVTLAYAMAIPLVLGSALSAYGDCRGTAGAIFGLFYYLLDRRRSAGGRMGGNRWAHRCCCALG